MLRNTTHIMEGGGEGSKSKDPKGSPAAAAAPEVKKGPWTAEEDAILIEHVRRNGEGNWNSVQRTSGLMRCGKSCRLRWANHLRPNLKKGQLTPEEELLVLRLHAQLGNKWARMAAQLPGRTDNEIKNYWNTRVKRRQRAGLPLYPPGVLQRHRPPPLLIPSTAPLSSSAPAFSSPMMTMPMTSSTFSPSSSAPRGAGKRERDDDDCGGGGGGTTMMMFRFPVSPVPSVAPRMWHTAPSTPTSTGATMFDYSIVPPMTPSTMPPSAYSPGGMGMVMARSSSCHVLDGSGGEELMEKLLQEAERAEQKEEREYWAHDPFGGFHAGNDPLATYNYSDQSDTGISVSDLFEMIPTQPAAPAAPRKTEWNNNSECSDVSNGGQSVLTNEDLTVDLHQLASSLPDAQMEPDWNISSCQWNNMPEIM